MRMSEYTAGQIATLQSRLQKQLGPEYINHRPGPGGGPALSYIEGWKGELPSFGVYVWVKREGGMVVLIQWDIFCACSGWVLFPV